MIEESSPEIIIQEDSSCPEIIIQEDTSHKIVTDVSYAQSMSEREKFVSRENSSSTNQSGLSNRLTEDEVKIKHKQLSEMWKVWGAGDVRELSRSIVMHKGEWGDRWVQNWIAKEKSV